MEIFFLDVYVALCVSWLHCIKRVNITGAENESSQKNEITKVSELRLKSNFVTLITTNLQNGQEST